MLKKAAIIVAGSAAVLVAASPLALASPTYSHSPKCSFSASNDNGVAQSATGFRALFGAAGSGANLATPANIQGQAPVASCNNVDNVLNTTETTTTVNRNRTRTVDESRVFNSGNSVFGTLPVPGLG